MSASDRSRRFVHFNRMSAQTVLSTKRATRAAGRDVPDLDIPRRHDCIAIR